MTDAKNLAASGDITNNGTIAASQNAQLTVQGELNQNQTMLDANGIKNGFDAQKVAEQQELGSATGYIGMRAAGDIASYMANHATTDAAQKAWSADGTNEVLLHGLGGTTSALGGGNRASDLVEPSQAPHADVLAGRHTAAVSASEKFHVL